MPKRRKPTARQRLEDRALDLQPWAGLRAQQRLQEQHHSAEENAKARAECQALVVGGYGQLPDFVAWLERQAPPRSRVVRTNRPAPAAEDRAWADVWKI